MSSCFWHFQFDKLGIQVPAKLVVFLFLLNEALGLFDVLFAIEENNAALELARSLNPISVRKDHKIHTLGRAVLSSLKLH